MESGKAQNTSPTLALSLAVGPQTSYLTSLGFCLLTCKINTDLPCGLYPLSLSLRGPIPLPPPPRLDLPSAGSAGAGHRNPAAAGPPAPPSGRPHPPWGGHLCSEGHMPCHCLGDTALQGTLLGYRLSAWSPRRAVDRRRRQRGYPRLFDNHSHPTPREQTARHLHGNQAPETCFLGNH